MPFYALLKHLSSTNVKYSVHLILHEKIDVMLNLIGLYILHLSSKYLKKILNFFFKKMLLNN